MNSVLSIIIPCYNSQDYILPCVKDLEGKISKSKFDQNVEIVIIDDGSTDTTRDICNTIIENYDNAHLFFYEVDGKCINRGQGNARNLGIEKSNGKWLMFLDSDDYLTDEFLDRLYSEIVEKKTACDILLTGYEHLEIGGETTRNVVGLEEGKYSAQAFSKHIFDEVNWGIVSCIGGKVYSSAFLKNNGIWFDEDKYKFNEDAAFFIETILNNPELYYMAFSSYIYVQRNGSVMHSIRFEQYKTIRNAYALLESLFDKYNEYDSKRTHVERMRVDLIYSSLLSIASSGYSSFRESAKDIMGYADLAGACKYMSKGKSIDKRRLFSRLLIKRHYLLLYFCLSALVKMRQMRNR